MPRKLLIALILPVAVVAWLVFAGTAAYAQGADDADDACNDGEVQVSYNIGGGRAVKTSDGSTFYCIKQGDQAKDPQGTAIYRMSVALLNFLIGIVGIAMVGGIVWGSWQYIMSNGNAGKAQEGLSIIVNSVVGLVVFIFLFAGLNFLVPGGLFR